MMLNILVTCAATMLFLAGHTGLIDWPNPQVSRPDENSRSFTQTKDQSNNPPESFILLHSVTVDSGEGSNDEARGIAIGNDGNIYVTGYVTRAGNGRDIWLAKYDKNLVYLDSVVVNGTANGDDEGYTMAFDSDGYLYLVGYMTEAGENNNIWLGKFNSDLVLQDDITLSGSENDADDGYGILFDENTGNLYVAGTLREIGEGANIFLGIFDTDLVLQDSIVLNGSINDTDKARFMTFDDSRHLFVSGSVTQAVTDYDIWIGKFQEDLTFVDEVIVAGPTNDEDKGYGIVFDGTDTVFVTGTMIEPGESYNIWMAAYDTDLDLLDSLTINGPVDGEDVAYLMTMDDRGRLFHTGVYTEVDGGSNVWVARFNTELELEAWTTLDGPAGGYDTGVGLVNGPDNDLYVSAVVSDPLEGLNIWIGHYDVSILFTDGFESGDTSSWSSMVP
jgi:hypothetical protein